MANRYWVGGTGTWSTSTTNWSTAPALALTSTSCSGTTLTTTGSPALVVGMTVWAANNTSLGTVVSGSVNTWVVSIGGTYASQSMTAATNGATFPTSTDSVFFNATSGGPIAYTVTNASAIACLDFTADPPTGGSVVFSLGGTGNLSCFGSFSGAAVGVSYTGGTGAIITFAATTTGNTITTNNVSLGSGIRITFAGVGGAWTLGSALSASLSTITLTSGSLTTANFPLLVANFSGSGSLARALDLGTSTVTLVSTGGLWTFTTTTNLTFTGSASTIIFTGGGVTFVGGGLTYNNVNFTGAAISTVVVTGANTFNTFSVASRTSSDGISTVSFAANQVISTLTLGTANTAVRRIFIFGVTPGIPISLTVTTISTLNDVDFKGITAIGGTPWTGTRLGDCGNNTSITFSASKTVYWNLAGAQLWSAVGWCTSTDGGVTFSAPDVNNFPLAQDTAAFTPNSSVTGVITVSTTWNVGSVIVTKTAAMTLSAAASAFTFYGDITLQAATVITTPATTWTFGGYNVTSTLTTNGATPALAFTISAVGSTFRLSGNTILSSSGSINLNYGTLDLNNFNLSLDGSIQSTGSTTRAIAFGTGNIILTNSTSAGLSIIGMGTLTNFTYTGTGGFVRNQVQTCTMTFGNLANVAGTPINLTVNGGAFALTITANSRFKNIDFTGSTCTVTGGISPQGTITLAAGGTYTGLNFSYDVSGTIPIYSPPIGSIAINAPGGTVTLSSALSLATTASFTLTAGTFDLNGFNLDVGVFSSTNTNTRAIAFGANNITLTSPTALATVLSMASATGFTWTGSGGFIRNQAATATATFGTTGGTTTNAPNLTVNAGASALTITTNSYFKNVDFTGSTVTIAANFYVCGNLTLATGGTYTSLVPTFLASGTFTSNTKTTGNVVINAPGGTVTLGDALTAGTGSTTTLTAGTLNLNGFNLSTGLFYSTTTSTRSIIFGANNISLTSTGAVLVMDTATNFSWTGTGGFTRSNLGGSAVYFGNFVGGTVSNAPNLAITGGFSTLDIYGYFKNVSFTGSTVTVTATYNACGNLTLGAGTYTAVAPTFLTSGTLTTNGKTISALTVNGSGTTTTLADALTTTGALTLTDGTLKLKSGVTTTVGSFVTTGTTLKYLQSTTPGVQATISDASGTNTATYLSIQDSAATGGAVWDSLGPTNVDAGNNTGWLFPSGGIIVIPTGVSTAGAIGNVTIYLLLVVSATGVQVIGVIGNVVVTGTAFVYPIGVVAYGLIGPVNVWGLVIDGQVPNWTIIADGLPSAWSAVSNPQTPSWQPVVN